jgi:5-methylcytosine-specific restriction protein A
MATRPGTTEGPEPGNWRKDKRKTSDRGYGWRWQKARLLHLRANPLCVMCQERGHVTLASVVDHRIPHRGDPVLFWDRTNWQSLCSTHHNSDKQMLEKSGRERTKFDAEGRVIW